MHPDLQKAGIWKRISAWLLDFILTAMLVVGVAYLMSAVLNYDTHSENYDAALEYYQKEYDTKFDVTQEEYAAMTQEELDRYEAGYQALIADEEAMASYNMVLNLMMVITTGSILLAMLIVEFVVPLLFGNGQTLGKKVFSISLVRVDSVKITPVQLFVRTILGKFTLGTMLPLYLLFLVLFGGLGTLGSVILVLWMLAQAVCPVVTREHRAIHDYLAGTVAVDHASQRIFASTQDLIDYKKKLHAEEVARKDY